MKAVRYSYGITSALLASGAAISLITGYPAGAQVAQAVRSGSPVERRADLPDADSVGGVKRDGGAERRRGLVADPRRGARGQHERGVGAAEGRRRRGAPTDGRAFPSLFSNRDTGNGLRTAETSGRGRSRRP